MNRKSLILSLLLFTLIGIRILININDQTTLLTLDNPSITSITSEYVEDQSVTNSPNAQTKPLSKANDETYALTTATEQIQVGDIRAYSPETDTFYSLEAFNQLDKETLMTFNGIGEVTAEAILKYRKENGPFKDFVELMEIKGIGEKKLAKIISENP